jgi:UDP-N-acetylglucosamine 4,6-dehydratase/5-epimerase
MKLENFIVRRGMANILAGKTVLVTGGTGSIGSEIVRQTLRQNAKKVIIFSRDEIKHFLIRKQIGNNSLETIVGDIRDYRSLENVFRSFNVDIVFHTAAMKHVILCEDFPSEAIATNVGGTQNVVDLALKYSVSKMITISTDKAAYPVNVMGATKFIAERITLNANRFSKGQQVFCCVRFGNVASSRGSVIPVYIDNLLNHVPLQVTNPEVTRFIVRISNAVDLIIKATDYAQCGEIFILKMKAFKLGDLADVMVDIIAPKLQISKKNIKLNITGLAKGEKLHEDLINELEASRLYEVDDMYIILPTDEVSTRNIAINKVYLHGYTSKDAELISKKQIEEIVMEYLENNLSKASK